MGAVVPSSKLLARTMAQYVDVSSDGPVIELGPGTGAITNALVEQGVCDAETVDTVVKEGFGARTAVLGPMEQSDLVGLDLALDIADVLYEHLDRTASAPAILRDKVKAGRLGMKTGEGLRTWAPGEADAVRARLSRFLAEQAKARKRAKT